RKDIPPFESYHYQTLALVQRFMEDESERATITYEGTRQLLAAVDFMPRSVELPQWIDFGTASFFTTPKGSFWPGVGTTSAPYFVKDKNWEQVKQDDGSSVETFRGQGSELGKNSVETLKNVITDKNFRLIKDAPNKEKATTKARTLAWALTFFLADKKLEGLRRYLNELRSVPRDLELDEDTLLTIFARAFDLISNNEIDESRLAALADAWYSFMKQTPLENGMQKKPDNNQRPPNTLRTPEAQPSGRR